MMSLMLLAFVDLMVFIHAQITATLNHAEDNDF